MSRTFEKIVGCTPIEYRNQIRIERAKTLLEDTSLPIQEIAATVGYSSATYFCDAFKKAVGVSPMKFRKD